VTTGQKLCIDTCGPGDAVSKKVNPVKPQAVEAPPARLLSVAVAAFLIALAIGGGSARADPMVAAQLSPKAVAFHDAMNKPWRTTSPGLES
jgi:hypothetical protein